MTTTNNKAFLNFCPLFTPAARSPQKQPAIAEYGSGAGGDTRLSRFPFIVAGAESLRLPPTNYF